MLIIIIFGALITRLYKIDNPIADWHSWRQADTASVSRFYVDDGIDLLHPRYHDLSSIATGFNNPQGWRYVEFPLYNALHVIAYKAFPNVNFDTSGRLTAVAISLLSIVFVYLIGARFLSRTGGLLSAFFFSFLPFNIYFSRVILPEPLAVLFTVSSLWFFIRWIDKDRFWELVTAAVLFAGALLIKPYTGFYALPMLYLAFSKFGVFGVLKNIRLWIFFSISLVPLLIWRGYMNQYLEGIPFWVWAFNGDGIRFRPAWWWWIFSERIGRLILGTWGLALFVFGFLHKGKDHPWFFQFVFLGQFVYFAVVATASVRHDYYQTLSVPAICLLVSSGVIFLWNVKSAGRWLQKICVVGIILLSFSFSFYQVKEYYKINHPEIILAGQVADRILPKDARVIAPYNGDTAFLYQTKRTGWPEATLPINEMINRLGAEYYISVNFSDQTKMVMEQFQVMEKTDQYVIVRLQ